MNSEFFRFNGEQPPSISTKQKEIDELKLATAQFIHDGGTVKRIGKTKKIDIVVNNEQVVNLNTISQVANKRKKEAAKRRVEREAKK